MKIDIEQSMESLERTIATWSKIEKLHFEFYITGVDVKHGKLYINAQTIVNALRHYKIELQESLNGSSTLQK